MSKVRPKRSCGLPCEPTQHVVLEPEVPPHDMPPADGCIATSSSTSGAYPSVSSSCSIASISSSAWDHSQSSPSATMFKCLPYNSEGGFGIMNPMYDVPGETVQDVTPPIYPSISSSQSLPIMPSDRNSLQSPTMVTSTNCPSLVSTSTQGSPVTPPMVTPPNTPLSPHLAAQTSPWTSRSTSLNKKDTSTLSPVLSTPPNTPFSNPSSPSDLLPNNVLSLSGSLNGVDQENTVYNPAMAVRGQLYNILGHPVDLPNTRPRNAEDIKISPQDTESNLYPFPSYPKPPSPQENEKSISDLLQLANGFYDERKLTSSEDCEFKSASSKDDLDDLEEKDKRIIACWSHKLLDIPKVKEQKQTEADYNDQNQKENSKMQNGHAVNVGLSPPEAASLVAPVGKEKKGVKFAAIIDDEPKQTKYRKDIGHYGSLFENLEVPMIDDSDDSSSKQESVTATISDGSVSSSLDSKDDPDGLRDQLVDMKNEAGRLIDEGTKYLTSPEDTVEFCVTDVITVIISLALFYFDLVSDCIVAYNMHSDPHTNSWFIVTVLFIVLPLILANALSLYWYWFDERVCEPEGFCYRHPKVPVCVWVMRFLAHLCLQGSVLRQLDILYYGTKSTGETMYGEADVNAVMRESQAVSSPDGGKKEMTKEDSKEEKWAKEKEDFEEQDSKRSLEFHTKGLERCSRRTGGVCSKGGYLALWIHAERDAANVDMLLALVQDAPQLIFHFYILAHTLPGQVEQGEYSQTLIWQMLKEGASFLTLAWSVTSFVRAIRLTEPTMGNLSLVDLLWLTMAHLCSIAGQVMTFSLVASTVMVAFWVVGCFHWVAMSSWILIQLWCFPRTTCTRAVFAHDKTLGPCSKLDDIFFSCVTGVIFLFTFVDVGGISPKTQFLIYHTFRLIEEVILLLAWFICVNGSLWYHWLPLMLVPFFFAFNMFFDALFCINTRPVTCIALNRGPASL